MVPMRDDVFNEAAVISYVNASSDKIDVSVIKYEAQTGFLSSWTVRNHLVSES